jgi:hypothetical protein
MFQGYRNIFIPEWVLIASLRGPAQGQIQSFDLLIQGDGVSVSPEIEDVSLTGLPFQANPTAEIHGV